MHLPESCQPQAGKEFFTLHHSLLFNSDLLLAKHMPSVLKLVESPNEVKGLDVSWDYSMMKSQVDVSLSC